MLSDILYVAEEHDGDKENVLSLLVDENVEFERDYCLFRHTKIKKPKVHFTIKIFLIENACKTPIGCLTFIFYRKYFL